MEGILNDVRDASVPLSANASSIHWYLQLAFELHVADPSSASPRPVSKFWWRHPWSVEKPVYADWWARYSVPNYAALTWWSGTMKVRAPHARARAL